MATMPGKHPVLRHTPRLAQDGAIPAARPAAPPALAVVSDNGGLTRDEFLRRFAAPEPPPAHPPHPNAAGDLPIWLIHRFVVEMQIASNAACNAAIRAATHRPAPLNRATYFLLILRCDRCFSDAAARPGSTVKPAGGISVSAIAASLDQPFETARRHVNALIDDGLCERRGPRVVVRRDMFDRPAVRQLLQDQHDILLRFIANVAAAGIALPVAHERDGDNPLATVAAAIDLSLAACEYGAPLFESWLQMRVLNAVFAGNTRQITANADLSRYFAFEAPTPPNALLIPVTPAEVARVLDLSVATARRHVRAAIDAGLLERRRSGVVYTEKMLALGGEGVLARAASQRALRTLERLAIEGHRFDEPDPIDQPGSAAMPVGIGGWRRARAQDPGAPFIDKY